MLIKGLDRETIISFNEKSEDAKVYTTNRKLYRQLDKNIIEKRKGIKLVLDERSSRNYVISKSYIIPKRWVKVKPPKQMSDKHLELLRAGKKELNKKKEKNIT